MAYTIVILASMHKLRFYTLLFKILICYSGYTNEMLYFLARTGKYVYIYSNVETSSEGDIAKLESGLIVATEQQCFSFWYFTTNSRDSVEIFQNGDPLLTLSYNYEEKIWNHIQIPLKKKSHDTFKLVIKVTHGDFYDGSKGAIVIDDILIENRNCDSYILNCDFETNPCDLNTDETKQYVWTKQRGQSIFDNTGPSTDHSTGSERGSYMYLGSQSDASDAETRTAYFEFKKVNIHVLGNICLTFWYHMYHDRYGREELKVELNDEIIWREDGKSDNQWKKGTIDLHNKTNIDIKFIGILTTRSNSLNDMDIAIDDILLTKGTCKGISYHEEICVPVDDKISKVTSCPKDYLDIENPSLSFDPKKEECSYIYDQIKTRILRDCIKVNDSQKCEIDPLTDISSQPECFQLYEFRILHTCEDKKTTTVSSDISSEYSSTGLAVGLVIGALILVCGGIAVIILIRRQTFKGDQRETIGNNHEGNDYIGSQDIALPRTTNHSRHMQNTGIYDGNSDTSVPGYDSINAYGHVNNVEHEYTNVGVDKGFVNDEKAQVPTYADHQETTFADKHMLNDDEYTIVDPTAETSFNETINNRTGTVDSYMILDPNDTGFNRTKFSNTPVGYEFAKPVRDTERNNGDEDQYAVSDGVYDHSENNRNEESEDNIYHHAVDTIYDSGSHLPNNQGREDTYDHFFGQQTEDDYDISTNT